MSWISGKKTYILALVIAALSVLQYFDVFGEDVYMELLGLVGAGGLASLRAGVTKSK
jgi:hypothetical protein